MLMIDEIVEALRRKWFFTGLDAAYAALWADDEATREELEERALWRAPSPTGGRSIVIVATGRSRS